MITHRERFRALADLLGGPLQALAEQRRDLPLAIGNQVHQLDEPVRVAPLQLHPAQVGGREDPLLLRLARETADVAEADQIEAQLVGPARGHRDLVDVEDAEIGALERARLVVRQLGRSCRPACRTSPAPASSRPPGSRSPPSSGGPTGWPRTSRR